jgi:cytochrome P450
VPNAVEESLRLEPAAAVVDRYATRDVTLGGAAIRRGELVLTA